MLVVNKYFVKVFRIQLFSKFLYMGMSLCFLLKFSICDIYNMFWRNSYALLYTKFICILSNLFIGEAMI